MVRGRRVTAADANAPAPAPAPIARRRNARGVAGPTSALTSFLREHGIQPTRPLEYGYTARNAEGGEAGDDAAGPSHVAGHPSPGVDDHGGAYTDRNTQSGPVEAGQGTPVYDDDIQNENDKAPIANSSKRKGIDKGEEKVPEDVDSDELDDEDFVLAAKRTKVSAVPSRAVSSDGVSTPSTTGLRGIGEFMPCGECNQRFTVTAYTKPHPTKPNAYVCFDCCTVLGIDPFAKTKKTAAKRAPAKNQKKESRNKVISYEERKGAVKLAEMCIKMIGKYIENVEALGSIGSMNMDKVCRIISKGRRLTPETATLFYSGTREDLAMFDCTNLTPDSFITLAALCPNLRSLRLDMCGRIDTDTMGKWGSVFEHLNRLELEGPFLVRVNGWIKFMEGMGDKLTGFLITQSPRFDLDCLKAMVKYCPNLQELRMSQFGLVCDEWLPIISELRNLVSLDLSSPGQHSLTDDPVIALLEQIGGNLETLNLSKHTALTHRVLIEGVAKFCPRIRHFTMHNMPDYAFKRQEDEQADPEPKGITNDGMARFFQAWKAQGHKGLVSADFHGNYVCQGEALAALIEHSGPVLESLNVSAWGHISPYVLLDLGKKCKNLRSLDLGWCRELTDFEIKEILEGCENLKSVKVWGCNQLTDAVPRKKGCKVIGIETHTI
ncbi:hypothetical protein QFC21_002038 [Naganishia friedmannii]|uniref:Uncharacterized protein n=1 Tax=Naganishia friedmannii TaxID=89922 RepID=A0ACC2VYY2_9TREE|nr:hypothetical protein QFC21_002038 [Naganishia friedmannii]